MKNLSSKLKWQETKVVFAIFMIAATLHQVASIILPTATAQSQSDVSGNVNNSYVLPEIRLVEETIVEENQITIQDNLFIQAPCYLGEDCLAAKNETVKESVVQQEINRVIVTAYSSTYDQTDSSPFITANGTYVYDGIVACNFLPFKTKIKFPELYGDKIFTVEDRMAKKNSYKMDIWMPSRDAALQFGVKTLAVEIVN